MWFYSTVKIHFYIFKYRGGQFLDGGENRGSRGILTIWANLVMIITLASENIMTRFPTLCPCPDEWWCFVIFCSSQYCTIKLITKTSLFKFCSKGVIDHNYFSIIFIDSIKTSFDECDVTHIFYQNNIKIIYGNRCLIWNIL